MGGWADNIDFYEGTTKIINERHGIVGWVIKSEGGVYLTSSTRGAATFSGKQRFAKRFIRHHEAYQVAMRWSATGKLRVVRLMMPTFICSFCKKKARSYAQHCQPCKPEGTSHNWVRVKSKRKVPT